MSSFLDSPFGRQTKQENELQNLNLILPALPALKFYLNALKFYLNALFV